MKLRRRLRLRSATETEATNFAGEWLPLKVWARRGFSPKQIKATATNADRKKHPRLGMVYRLTLEQDLMTSAKQKIYNRLLESTSKTSSKKRKLSNMSPSKASPQKPTHYQIGRAHV